MSAVRVVIYGLGEMGTLAANLCLDRGVEIVGAIARSPSKVGQDVGTVIGRQPIGVRVSSDAAAVLSETRPDVALVSVTSYMAAMESHFRTCIDHGVNVLTLEEETLFPWSSAGVVANAVDRRARDIGVTVAATGVQDLFWNGLASLLMASASEISYVRGRSTWNSDDYGPEVERYLHIGEHPSVITESDAFAEWDALAVRTSLLALAHQHRLTVVDMEESLTPIVSELDTRSAMTGRIVAAGSLLGLSELVRVITAEGPTLELELAGYLHAENERCYTEWTVGSEPCISLRVDPFPGRFVTCTALINRIPDVMSAPPGLLTIDRLPPMSYRHGALAK